MHKIKYILLAFTLLTAPAVARDIPQWLTDLKDQQPREIVIEDKITVDKPSEDDLGFWRIISREETPIYYQTRLMVINGNPTKKRIKEIHVKIVREWVHLGFYFHLNTDSQIIHAPWCRYYDCDSCTMKILDIELWTSELGAKPCGLCKPLERE